MITPTAMNQGRMNCDKPLPLRPLSSTVRPPHRNPERKRTKQGTLHDSSKAEIQALQRQVETLASHNNYLARQNDQLQKQVDRSKERLSDVLKTIQNTLQNCVKNANQEYVNGDEGTITICRQSFDQMNMF